MKKRFSLICCLTLLFIIGSANAQDSNISENEYKIAAKKVIMFSATYCPNCLNAKKFLNTKNIPFMEFDIETSASARRYFDKLGGRGTPFMLVNNHPIQGFNPEEFNYYYYR